MGCILYVFPHPDDESFGPAPAIARQRRLGHDVHLLTLTRGEATKQRHRFGYSLEQMGDVREAEMRDVARVLDLTSFTLLKFPDGGFEELCPHELERAISAHVREVHPDVLVTYAAHGISGHPDHTIAHTIVKGIFCSLSGERVPNLRRLALFTLDDSTKEGRAPHLRSSAPEVIDCIVPVDEADLAAGAEALACYRTYQEPIAEHDPLGQVRRGVRFELFREDFTPPIDDLFAQLPGSTRR